LAAPLLNFFWFSDSKTAERFAKVPKADDTLLPLIAEDVERGSVHPEQAAGVGRQAQPSGRKDPKYVTMCEQNRIPRNHTHSLDYSVSSGANFSQAFAFIHIRRPDGPSRTIFPYVSGLPALKDSVVPFLKVRINDGLFVKTRQ